MPAPEAFPYCTACADVSRRIVRTSGFLAASAAWFNTPFDSGRASVLAQREISIHAAGSNAFWLAIISRA